MITMYEYILFKPNKIWPIAAFVSGICLSYPVKYRKLSVYAKRAVSEVRYVIVSLGFGRSDDREGEGHAPVTVCGASGWTLSLSGSAIAYVVCLSILTVIGLVASFVVC